MARISRHHHGLRRALCSLADFDHIGDLNEMILYSLATFETGGAGRTPLTAPHHQRSSASAAASRAVGQIQKKSCLRLPHDSKLRALRNWVVSLHGILSNLVAKKNTGFCYGWRSFTWLLLPMALQVFFCAHNSANHRFSPICGSSWSRFARSYFGSDQSARKHSPAWSLTVTD